MLVVVLPNLSLDIYIVYIKKQQECQTDVVSWLQLTVPSQPILMTGGRVTFSACFCCRAISRVAGPKITKKKILAIAALSGGCGEGVSPPHWGGFWGGAMPPPQEKKIDFVSQNGDF